MTDWLPLIGVLLSQVVILLLFVLKQRADDQRRWHERRLDLYVSFLDSTRRIRRSLEAARRGDVPKFVPLDELDATLDDLHHEISRLDILAPESVGDAGTTLWSGLILMRASLDDELDEDQRTSLWTDGEEFLAEGEAEFEREVRRSLGVKSRKPQRANEDDDVPE